MIQHRANQPISARKQIPRAFRIACLVAFLSIPAGCKLDRSMFQFDSNSRVPFLGFQLSSNQRGKSGDTAPVVAVGDTSNGNRAVPTVAKEEKSNVSLIGLLKNIGRPKRLPLPQAGGEKQVDSEVADADFARF